MKNRKFWGVIAFLFTLLLAMNLQVPYYITKPGSALALADMVEVENGYDDEKGSFRLTTVRMGPASVAGYLYAVFSPYVDLVESSMVHSPHETDEQYTRRQLEIMKASQDTAKIVAFQRSGIPIQLKNSGAVIMQLLPGYAAENVLQIGDVVTRVNERKIETAADLIDSLKGKKEGDHVTLTFFRDGQKKEAVLTLKLLPVADENGRKKPGIGVASPVTKREFKLPKEVTIKSEEIGGPSAGLMFTLEMINQLTPGDLTKGYQIAGTGTINEDGTIGRIGGIHHKVVAADREHAEIFFAPVEKDDSGVSNYDEALERAKELGTSMKIVPVRTIDDALDYLEKLPPKA